MYTTKTDQELIQLYLSGEKKAIETLIVRHKRRIFTSIFMLVKDRHIAEDVFQDTFIKVINTLQAGNYNEEGKFLPWVLRIAHNLVIDHFRFEKRMPMTRDTEEYSIFDILDLKQGSVQDSLIQQQIYDQVRKLVEHLPDDQRQVLVMRHYADMSFKEIADATGVSINTALGRMRYALINMRKLIEKHQLVLQA